MGGSTAALIASSSSTATLADGTCGIKLQDIELIASGVEEFGLRVTHVIDIVATLAELRKLVENIKGLPRVEGLWGAREGAAGGGSLVEINEREQRETEGSGERLPPLTEEEMESKREEEEVRTKAVVNGRY